MRTGMARMGKLRTILAIGLAVLATGAAATGVIGISAAGPPPQELVLVKQISVPADAGWVDTGLDAVQGDEFHIKGLGEICLQRGNPAANCGPAGLDLMTGQQPIPDQNIGALVGKVAQLVSVRKDEDTGEEIRDEIAVYFFVGIENDVTVPLKGRLYLGVNENVVKDNTGEFTAFIYKRRV